jgi:tartrate-resistant acid phosphatase type 5
MIGMETPLPKWLTQITPLAGIFQIFGTLGSFLTCRYTSTLNVPNSDSTVQFIFYDTQIFADMNTTELYQEQFQWIKTTLASSKADWLFVLGHYPVWSVGSHGPTPALLRDLMPLLHQYKVDAYIGGHEHNMEHIRDDLYPIDYFIAGAGGHDTSHKAEHSNSVPPNSLKFFWPTSKEGKSFQFSPSKSQRNLELL